METTTFAARVAAALDDDGQQWTARDGRTWEDLTAEASHEPCPDDPDVVRVEWPDGSAIIATPTGWDLAAGPGCWCWDGPGHAVRCKAGEPNEVKEEDGATLAGEASGGTLRRLCVEAAPAPVSR